MSTTHNQSTNGHSGGGGGGGEPDHTENPQANEPTDEEEFGRTEEGK